MTQLPTLFPAAWGAEAWTSLAISVLFLAWIPSEVLYRLKGKIKSEEDAKSSEWMGTAMLINFAVMPTLIHFRVGAIAWHPTWVSYLGIAVTAAGTLLRYWAIITLGQYFTSAVMVQGGQGLITRGPFRMVRHPGYAGVLMFGAGIALGFANWLATAFFLVLQGAAMLYRIRVEEAVMREAFGPTYDEYAARSWKLVPFVF